MQFTQEQEDALIEVANPSVLRSNGTPEKLAILANIFGGVYEIFLPNEALLNLYVDKLLKYLKLFNMALPDVLEIDHPKFVSYIKKREEAEKARTLKVPETNKEYLKDIQKQFSSATLSYSQVSEFPKRGNLYLCTNDAFWLGVGIYNHYRGKNINSESTSSSFNLLNAIHPKLQRHRVGVVIGNGDILSLLPNIDADDIILLDVEPIVHFFLLAVRTMILNTDDNKDFEFVKKELNQAITDLELKIKKLYRCDVYSEFKITKDRLEDLHFLSSQSRFAQCKKALQEKELIPVTMDLFNASKMEELGKALRMAHCQVSFMNLTNVADYDKSKVLMSGLEKLPFVANPKIITTCIGSNVGRDIWRAGHFVSYNLEELKVALEYNYYQHDKSFKLTPELAARLAMPEKTTITCDATKPLCLHVALQAHAL